VDIKNHKEVVFRTGPLRKAIRASVSIPTVLKPVFLNDVELIDGGVLNPLPISCINRNEGDLLIAVDLGADIPYPIPKSKKVTVEQETNYRKTMDFINEKWTSYFNNDKQKHTGFFDLITESLYAMQMKLTQSTIKEYKPHMVVHISRKSCDLFEYHRSEELIEYGRKQFKKSLSDYKAKIKL
jgi:NTE family protein